MSPRNPLSIEWTENTWEDVNGIADYLLGEGVAFETVEGYMKRIFQAPEHLATLPGAGKPGRAQGTREWRVKSTPYVLIYRVLADRIQVLRVLHDSRQFPEQ